MVSLNTLKWLQVGTTALEAAANLSAGYVARKQGQRDQLSKQLEAHQLREQATQTFAANQRLALEELRNAEYVASRALAVAGASGGGVSDPTVMNVVTNIKSEGALRAAWRLYEAEEGARQKRRQAAAAELEGNDAMAAGKYRQKAWQVEAIGAIGEGASNLYARYGVRPAGG